MLDVKAWAQKRFGCGKAKVPEDGGIVIPKGLPILPVAGRTSFSQTPATSSSSPFFQWLPIEIRRAIYLAAFGKRTLHMDLQYKSPDVPGPYHSRLPGRESVDDEGPKAWRWWSCVCHRNPTPVLVDKLFFDDCRIRAGTCCADPGGLRDGCFLGVMGWLLTCRQAYTETVEILYASNTIFIHSVVLTTHITRFLVPQSLASITSLEFLWDLNTWPDLYYGTKFPKTSHQAIYEGLMSQINRSIFTNLQKLLIVVDNLRYDPFMSRQKAFQLVSNKPQPVSMLHPADRIFEQFDGKLQKFLIMLPPPLFAGLLLSIGPCDISRGGGGTTGYKRVWRTLPDAIQDKQDFYGPERDLGYWVYEGVDRGPLLPSTFL